MEQKKLHRFIKNSNAIEHVYSEVAIWDSMEAWSYLEKQEVLTKDVVLNVHWWIMKHLNADIAGRIRKCGVYVGGRICPDPFKVEALLLNWLEKWGKGLKIIGIPEWSPLQWRNAHSRAAQHAHVEFEHIHPFEDGNGRTGRLLWLWHREQQDLPFTCIDVKKVQEYYKWFTQ